jgi:hypothetical protein
MDYAPAVAGHSTPRDIAKALPAQQHWRGRVQQNPALGSTGFKKSNFNGYG